MYLKFFDFAKEPFHISPDPEFLYLSPSHREALAVATRGVVNRMGFITIIGDVGLGKTTILHSFLERIDRTQIEPVLIFNVNVSFTELLRIIFQELGLHGHYADLFEMVGHFKRYLSEEYARGRNVVVIIDEAQNMPVETLKNLSTLFNFETPTQKLLQILLVGQPEFQEKLNSKELSQLKQRIALRAMLTPLTRKESLEYIEHRLSKVTSASPRVFGILALRRIVHYARGIPRVINVLCDNALITAYGFQKKTVSLKIVNEVIADFDGTKNASHLKWAVAALACVLLVIFLLFASPYAALMVSLLRGTNPIPPAQHGTTGNVEQPPAPAPTKMDNSPRSATQLQTPNGKSGIPLERQEQTGSGKPEAKGLGGTSVSQPARPVTTTEGNSPVEKVMKGAEIRPKWTVQQDHAGLKPNAVPPTSPEDATKKDLTGQGNVTDPIEEKQPASRNEAPPARQIEPTPAESGTAGSGAEDEALDPEAIINWLLDKRSR